MESIPRFSISRFFSGRTKCELHRVIDGDTIVVAMHFIDSQKYLFRVRLRNVFAPELRETGGQSSKLKLENLLANKTIEIQVFSDDAFGRLVSDIYADDVLVNALLFDNDPH